MPRCCLTLNSDDLTKKLEALRHAAEISDEVVQLIVGLPQTFNDIFRIDSQAGTEDILVNFNFSERIIELCPDLGNDHARIS